MPVGEVPSSYTSAGRGRGNTDTDVCLKPLSFPVFRQEWDPKHYSPLFNILNYLSFYSPCASAPPSPPCVDTHRVLTTEEQGEAGKPSQEENLLRRAALQQSAPDAASASW